MMEKLPMDEIHIQGCDGPHGTKGTQFRIAGRPPTDDRVPDGDTGRMRRAEYQPARRNSSNRFRLGQAGLRWTGISVEPFCPGDLHHEP